MTLRRCWVMRSKQQEMDRNHRRAPSQLIKGLSFAQKRLDLSQLLFKVASDLMWSGQLLLNPSFFVIQEHNTFKEKAKETRERVKLLLQLADTLVETGHAHAPSIKSWVDEVDATYKDFSTRYTPSSFHLTSPDYTLVPALTKNSRWAKILSNCTEGLAI